MSQLIEVKVPDIGDFSAVPVIEICVKVGDKISAEDALITLESDKATMDVPSPVSGIVKEIRVSLDERVSEGTVIATVEAASEATEGTKAEQASEPTKAPSQTPPPQVDIPAKKESPLPLASSHIAAATTPLQTANTHASPSVRLFARELGVDLSRVPASGPKGRILREDITAFVKQSLSQPQASGMAGAGLDLLPWPKVDFEKFGPIEVQPLSRIKKISGQNLARNWVMIPAVTYHEDADITELEAFRVALNKESAKAANGVKVTMLAFIIKACEMGLKKFPEFNSSIDGDNLVLKKYFNIGFAADTPNGLVVPVIKNVDQKSISQIATECGELAKKARDGKLAPAEMTGACFTISSLGGIGGTYFSPIVNAPEVAILGVNKAVMKPVWNGEGFEPRLTLPLSLSADHRVIDGALATRFNVFVAELLADMRRALV